ncbi:MAG: AraC family transcriptional regulator [Bacteroidales bacterium]|nr:AraC family transcriptional regulator [Bacteroidales bacterium]
MMYYAEQMSLTPRYLLRVTKEFSGCGTAKWIDTFVVAEIQYQMRYTMRSVQQIAYDMNFPNQSSLANILRLMSGARHRFIGYDNK